jgi:hypothetical protein
MEGRLSRGARPKAENVTRNQTAISRKARDLLAIFVMLAGFGMIVIKLIGLWSYELT